MILRSCSNSNDEAASVECMPNFRGRPWYRGVYLDRHFVDKLTCTCLQNVAGVFTAASAFPTGLDRAPIDTSFCDKFDIDSTIFPEWRDASESSFHD
jgi:hypothetical protein